MDTLQNLLTIAATYTEYVIALYVLGAALVFAFHTPKTEPQPTSVAVPQPQPVRSKAKAMTTTPTAVIRQSEPKEVINSAKPTDVSDNIELPVSSPTPQPILSPEALEELDTTQLRKLCSKHQIKWRGVRDGKHLRNPDMIEALKLKCVAS